MTRTFTVSDFDFDLPPELIAQHPAAERSASRLLDGTGPTPVDRVFRDLSAQSMTRIKTPSPRGGGRGR